MAFLLVLVPEVVIGWLIVKEVYKVVKQIVEMVIQLINILLGWKPDEQIIEYFEVENFPLFGNNDQNNPLANSVVHSVMQGTDLIADLIYASTFRDMKGNFRKFMQFIVNGNYFENLPTVESYIVAVDYDEVSTVLLGIHGEAVTIEAAQLDALNEFEWTQYWLQENKTYDVGLNELGAGTASTSTSPITPAADNVTVTPSANHFEVDITSEVATEDSVDVSQIWSIDFGSIVYNSIPQDYSMNMTNGVITIPLPYTIPTKPLNLHYIIYYYINSNPNLTLLFVYQVGLGTYPTLDTVENPIAIDNNSLQAVPAIPLRIANANFTTFGATKAQQIIDICDLVDLDPQELVDGVLNDPNVLPGDIDNIYLNFGVRLRDTSEVAMEYLFNMCENLFAAQAVTKGIYDSTPPADEKPANTIITTTDDNKQVFMFNYITFKHTTLTEIDGNTGSIENGVYYSNASKFDSSNKLVYPYFISSFKGTYNVGYKADTLSEVADFLAGSGVVNPGVVSAEGTNWLQVTTRMTYNNPTPALLESDDTASTAIFLTPDRVYENNGAGVLRTVEQVTAETTAGQSATYYEATISGLNAYTLHGPISAMRVVDGDTGKFKMVKFNLGGEKELMAPFIHSFIADRSKASVTKLFLSGAHLSVYVARYEVIQPATLSILEAALMLVLIIVVIVIIVVSLGSATAAAGAFLTALAAATATAAFVLIMGVVGKILLYLLIAYLIKEIITEVAKHDVALAIILGIIAAIGLGAYNAGGLMKMSTLDMAFTALSAVDNVALVFEVRDQQVAEGLETDQDAFDREAQEKNEAFATRVDALAEVQEEVFGVGTHGAFDLINNSLRATPNTMYAEHLYGLSDAYYDISSFIYEIDTARDLQLSVENAYV